MGAPARLRIVQEGGAIAVKRARIGSEAGPLGVPTTSELCQLCGARNLCQHKLNLLEWTNPRVPSKTQRSLQRTQVEKADLPLVEDASTHELVLVPNRDGSNTVVGNG